MPIFVASVRAGKSTTSLFADVGIRVCLDLFPGVLRGAGSDSRNAFVCQQANSNSTFDRFAMRNRAERLRPTELLANWNGSIWSVRYWIMFLLFVREEKQNWQRGIGRTRTRVSVSQPTLRKSETNFFYSINAFKGMVSITDIDDFFTKVVELGYNPSHQLCKDF